jgi:ribosome biogenesis GTPase / thiamine phosphate phosphatase
VAQVHGVNVEVWDGCRFQEAALAGQLRIAADRRHLNPLAVGDEVEVEHGGSGTRLRVTRLHPRRTFLERATRDRRGRTQIIAANACQAMIVSSLAEPPFRPGLVDRWALLARRGGITPVLCLNKVDLGTLDDAHRAIEEAAIPLESHLVSARTGDGIEGLRQALSTRKTVLVGHSGVGKSSLLQRLVPEADAPTGELSAKSGKGRHTTTSARLYPFPEGGVLIDTPGVRSVALGRPNVEEVASTFEEIANAPPCRFRSCTHRAEPGCSVLAGLDAGTFPRGVYSRYLRLLEEAEVP